MSKSEIRGQRSEIGGRKFSRLELPGKTDYVLALDGQASRVERQTLRSTSEAGHVTADSRRAAADA
jgi:hypothetical protein